MEEIVNPYRNAYKTSAPDRYEKLRENASVNRHSLTTAEYWLWQRLRAGQLGYKFRRQHAIADYIVDFVCLKCKFIIEVDGGYHFTEEQQGEDLIRTHRLEELGYTVFRVKNEDVLFATDEVIAQIQAALAAYGERHAARG